MTKISNYALTAALLTGRAIRTSAEVTARPKQDDTPSTFDNTAACTGVISAFEGACNYDNFVENLTEGCDVATLFPDEESTPEKAVEELCEYDAPTQFVEIQGTYQRDRLYFAGGGALVDGENYVVDSARITRFEANAGSKTVIAWPDYFARVLYNTNNGGGNNGYPANMNLETSCQLKTAMCCFADDSQGKGFVKNGDTATDVCRHDLAASPQSNHIKNGWSVFPGEEAPAHCVGFTWKDGEEELLGNMMFDVSLGTTARKGYRANVPGAPMCGCVEHMPVVETAACRTASVTGGVSYAFRYDPDTGYVGASNSAEVVYADCEAADLKAQYVANQEGDADKAALVDGHLVGEGGCAQDVQDYLNEVQYIGEGESTRYLFPDADRWSDLVVGEGSNFQPPMIDQLASDAHFRGLVEAGCTDPEGEARHCIVRRTCASCTAESHRDIYYQRVTTLPPPGADHGAGERYFLDLFMNEWTDDMNDMEAGDFALYSSYEDALEGTNAWKYCNYNYSGVGFPFNCGPLSAVDYQWNAYTQHKNSGYANHHGFYVEKP